jgi:demethylmenaquinone methyltransferase/2-methoxy-6-polyprenyl-1,4-benzoquinol methylase
VALTPQPSEPGEGGPRPGLELPRDEEKRSQVRAMFDRIAPRYDAMNRLLTAGLDQRWRRAALDAVGVGRGDRVLDLASGTGDLAELAAARGARVVGVDFAREMLCGARRRRIPALWIQGDAASLPLPDGCATVVTCGFALRNFASLPEVLGEMARVLESGGRLSLLEVDRPSLAVVRAGHSLYFDRVVPRVGGWLSDRAAYTYLPRSTVYLPAARELAALIEDAGFQKVQRRPLLLGSAQIITAVRARRESREAT